MEQEDRKEQSSVFSDFLGVLGFLEGKKLPSNGETTGQEKPESPHPEPPGKALKNGMKSGTTFRISSVTQALTPSSTK
jgi:hypothetical protein